MSVFLRVVCLFALDSYGSEGVNDRESFKLNLVEFGCVFNFSRLDSKILVRVLNNSSVLKARALRCEINCAILKPSNLLRLVLR